MNFLKSRRFKEVIGIFVLMMGILISVSLYSFNNADPYISSFDFDLDGRVYKNFAGCVGATTSHYLLEALGFGVFFFTALVFFAGFNLLFFNKLRIRLSRIAGVILLFFSTTTILSLVWKSTNFRSLALSGGGDLGDFLVAVLARYLNLFGAWIITITLFLLGLIFLTDFSFAKLIRTLVMVAMVFLERLGGFLRGLKNVISRSHVPRVHDFDVSKRTKVVRPRKVKRAKEQRVKNSKTQLTLFQDMPITYRLPIHKIFEPPKSYKKGEYERENRENAERIVNKLKDFGIDGNIVSFMRGPVITRFEYKPAPKVKINKIVGAADDLALALKTKVPPRIAHVPGRGVIGVEIPNNIREEVNFLQIISSEEYENDPSILKIALGVDISGMPYITDLAKMPHLLIAGATGTGKSVCINAILCSLLINASPEELRLLLIDPKMLELSLYNGVPHLRESVITDYKKAAVALEWAVGEMNERYRIIASKNVRNIEQYNDLIENIQKDTEGKEPQAEEELKKMPYYVIVIDELADLILAPGTNVDESITRLAQMARASGIHLVLATQRPSVDVVTGIIKANFPCRISFQVSSKVDSRTILDANGAEKLLGFGDMLFIPPSSSNMQRLHGAYVSEQEVKRLVKYLRGYRRKHSEDSIFKIQKKNQENKESDFAKQDELYQKAVELVVTTRMASVSMLQRKLRVGHSRAARLVDMMEEDGIVGPFEGSKTREVLVDKSYLATRKGELNNVK